MMELDIDISIVIPVYFNEGSLKRTYQKLKDEVFSHFPHLKFETIFIDDGSKDNSFEELVEIRECENNVRLIRFTRNFGQVSAIYAGYKYAKGQGILNIAADLQEPTTLLIDLIQSFISQEAKIVAGKRIDRDESLYRKKTSQVFYFFMKRLSFQNMPLGGFDVVIIDEKVRDFVLGSNESNPFWQGQLLWSGYSVKFIPYSRLKREVGKSRWTFGKKLKYLLDGVLNYSYLPLRLFSVIGIISFFLGILYSIVITITFFLGYSPFKGWAPLMIIILLFSGLQLMVTGLIGEYLWRNFEQSKGRVPYVIDEVK